MVKMLRRIFGDSFFLESRIEIDLVILLATAVYLFFTGVSFIAIVLSVFILVFFMGARKEAELSFAAMLSAVFFCFYKSIIKLVAIWDIPKLTKTVEFFHNLGYVRCIIIILVIYCIISFFLYREEV